MEIFSISCISIVLVLFHSFEFAQSFNMLRSFRPNIITKVQRSSRTFSSSSASFTNAVETAPIPLVPDESPIQNINYKNFDFKIGKTAKDSKARLGEIKTPHGTIETPNFIFCGTKGALKFLTTEQLKEAGAQIMLSNTFHLMLSPGHETVEKLGGLHKMSGWNGPMLTDSGGYQIFSMGYGSVSNEIKGTRFSSKEKQKDEKPLVYSTGEEDKDLTISSSLKKITEDGAIFTARNQNTFLLTPEKSMEIQKKLGADLIVVFDECTPYHATMNYTELSMHRSHRWGDRSLKAFNDLNSREKVEKKRQALYGVVQGGVYKDFRDVSVSYVNSRPFFGSAIGGCLGADTDQMHDIVAYTRAQLRDDRPVHLLGIGKVVDIFFGVRQGIDTFDCVHPLRIARHGSFLVKTNYWDELEAKIREVKDEDVVKTLSTDSDIIKLVQRMRSTLLNTNIKTLNYIYADANKRQFTKVADVNTELFFRWVQLKKLLNKTINRFHSRVEQQKFNMNKFERDSQVSQAYESYSENVTNILNQFLLKSVENFKKNNLQITNVTDAVSITNSKFVTDTRPLDSTCECYTCKNFSRGYLNHLFKVGEGLGGKSLSPFLLSLSLLPLSLPHSFAFHHSLFSLSHSHSPLYPQCPLYVHPDEGYQTRHQR